MNERILHYMSYHPVRTQRGLEILTGLAPWIIILFPFIGSFFIPEVVAYFVIAFNVYWLYRSIQLAIFASSGYLNIRATEKIDWGKKLQEDIRTKANYRQLQHLIIIPTVNEPLEMLERNLNSLVAQNFPAKNLNVVLAMEERAGKEAHERADKLIKKYKKNFRKIFATFHTLGPGETIGKHSNDTYAAKIAKRILVDEDKIPIGKIIVTVEDADTVFPKQYFSLLTYKFLLAPERYQKFFQAPRFPYNNLHRVPLFVKLPSIISGVNDLAILQKYSKRFVISSVYSTSLKLLESVNYWDLDYIPEDWHLFFKCYFTYGGKIEIIPLFVPIYIDAAEASNRRTTLKNFYEQNKRWAWGIVDVPYVIKNFFLHPEIPFWDKLTKLSLVLEFHFLWSSYWFLITLGATVPTIINPVFARTALGFNLSKMSSFILTFALTGLITIVVVDTLINPAHKERKKLIAHLLHPLTYLQWIAIPIGGLFFGALPGLEAETRLMLGKYLGYHVTEKVVGQEKT